MTNLITREFNGKKIRQREDGYISATDICQASGKRMNNWLRLKSTEEYLEALSDDLGIPVVGTNTHCADSDITNYLIEINKSYLIEINVGGSLENNGSWVHRLVAIELAGWCNVRLRIQCNKWVEELLTKGYVIKSDVTSEQLEDLQMRIQYLEERKSDLLKSKQLSFISGEDSIKTVSEKILKLYGVHMDGKRVKFIKKRLTRTGIFCTKYPIGENRIAIMFEAVFLCLAIYRDDWGSTAKAFHKQYELETLGIAMPENIHEYCGLYYNE